MITVCCRGCTSYVLPRQLHDGLCAECEAKAYRRNSESWRITDD